MHQSLKQCLLAPQTEGDKKMQSNAEFDRYAETYNDLLRDPVRDRFVQTREFYHRRKWGLITDFLQRRNLAMDALQWLDVGCGKGELLNYGRPHFRRVVGCDPSIEMARNTNGIEIHLQEKPGILPFPDATFDFITAVCVFHHVQDVNRQPLCREIHRVLRSNGLFCMIEHNPFNPITQQIVSQCPVDVDARLLTARLARSYAEATGLRHIETQYFLYLPERLYNRIGSLETVFRSLPLGGQYAMMARKVTGE